MGDMSIYCFCVILACTVAMCIGLTSFDNILTPACEISETQCHFHLRVEYMSTMVYVDEATNDGYVVVERDGKLYKRTSPATDCGSIEELTDEESEKVLYGDGGHRVVFAINNQFPGPSIVAYEGTELIIHFENGLRNELVTIHWHGVPMEETPWMDGVQDINQCGIRPEEAFTYRFTPKKAGTYWYHAHVGEVRQDGLFGALIILERTPDVTHVNHLTNVVPDGVDPDVAEEFVLHVQDFYPRLSPSTTLEKDLKIYGPLDYNNLEECTFRTVTSSASVSHQDAFYSALINGKGQYYENGSDEPAVIIPKEVLHVESNKVYRIRVIHSGVGFAFKLTIPQHQLHIVSLDGRNIEPIIADSLVVTPGERLDAFIITSNSPDNYEIIFETLEKYDLITRVEVPPHYVVGNLLYSDAPENTIGVSLRDTVCDAQTPCSIFNCIYENDGSDNICLTLNDAKSTPAAKALIPPPKMPDNLNDFQEFFLDFSVMNFGRVGTINNKRFIWPTEPPSITRHSLEDIITPCSDDSYALESCTHIVKVDLGRPVQFVLTNIVANYNPSVKGFIDHPIHFHGYHLTVLKVGYPKYEDDGIVKEQTSDIKCLDDSCLVTGWSDDSWKGGNIPGVNLQESNLKDTIVVPVGGYVVARINADNPGYWLVHCHTEKHMSSGMAMIVQVGEEDEMLPPPPGMPRDCGHFEWDGSYDYFKGFDKWKRNIRRKTTKHKPRETLALDVAQPKTTSQFGGNIMTIIAVTTGNVLVLAVILSVVFLIKKHKKGGYRRIESQDAKAALFKP